MPPSDGDARHRARGRAKVRVFFARSGVLSGGYSFSSNLARLSCSRARTDASAAALIGATMSAAPIIPPFPTSAPVSDGEVVFVAVAALRGKSIRRLTRDCVSYKEALSVTRAATALGLLGAIVVKRKTP